jgi:hypothetical protein
LLFCHLDCVFTNKQQPTTQATKQSNQTNNQSKIQTKQSHTNKATIVGMAQDFVGSGNNLPLLEASGMFGTRARGGDDAAQVLHCCDF